MKVKSLCVLIAVCVSTSLQAGSAYGLEIREAQGVPVLWEQGMPYFTRFTRSDHEKLSLAGTWKFMPDPGDAGEDKGWHKPGLDDSDWHDLPVPGSWNAAKEQWLYYQGAGWYRSRFHVPSSMQGRFNRLVLDGVAYHAVLFLNGRELARHHGGFSRWCVDVSGDLVYGGENVLVIRVSNQRDFHSLPALKHEGAKLGWWFYGGINREPLLDSGPRISAAKLATDTDHRGEIEGDLVIYNSGTADADAEVEVWVSDLSGRRLQHLAREPLKVAGKGVSVVRFGGRVDGVKPWSPKEPGNRYLLEVSVKGPGGSERQSVEIGFRKFEFRNGQAFLNDRPIFLRGINRHEDFPGAGPVQSDYWIERDIELLHDLHVNFMRPAHYPHDPRWLDACDREGILITHEIPFYQLGASIKGRKAMQGERLINNARQQLIETIERDRNHPCVVMWSVGNENRTWLRWVKEFHAKLIETAKEFDPVRPVTFAISTDWFLSPYHEITAELADALFINEYYGWYFGEAHGIGDYLEKAHRKWPEKPIVVSEFGAGASPLVDGEKTYSIGMKKKDFTEEYQAELHRVQYDEILSKDFVTGTMPWILADFRDDKRPLNPVPDFNLKGLVTYDREKKEAFQVVADRYRAIEQEYGW